MAGLVVRLHKEKEPEKLKQLHAGGIDGISCQHLQVMMTQLLQKHWEWAKRRKTSVSECDGSATAQAELVRAFVDANCAVVGGRPSVEGSPKRPNQRG